MPTIRTAISRTGSARFIPRGSPPVRDLGMDKLKSIDEVLQQSTQVLLSLPALLVSAGLVGKPFTCNLIMALDCCFLFFDEANGLMSMRTPKQFD